MSKDDRCPKCGVRDHNNNANVCDSCSLPYELWPWARRMKARAEIGARAVEVLHQAGIGRWPMLDKQFRSDAEPILADARDAGMVP